jgi:hypothetical protein
VKNGSVNDVLEQHANSNTPLKLCLISEKGEGYCQDFALLEGSQEALRFVADLIYAHLESGHCELGLHPKGAGSAHLDEALTVGLILHSLPCDISPDNHYSCSERD